MSPVERDILSRKLEIMVTALRLLTPIGALSLDEYRAEVYRRKATERLLQELVDAAVDVNAHVLVATGHPAPDDLHSSFIDLGTAGIIEPALAAALAPSAGLRNRLVHEYDRLDDGIVLRSVTQALAQYPLYIAALERFLEAA